MECRVGLQWSVLVSPASPPPMWPPAPLTSRSSRRTTAWAGMRTRTSCARAIASWRSTPGSSCTTRGPTRCCCGSSPSSACRPSPRRCRCRSATTARASSGRAPWVWAGCSRRGARFVGGGTCGCSSRSPGSTAAPAPCSPGRTTRARCGSSSPTAASRRTSSGTSWSRWSPPSGRATPRSRWTTPPATCSRSWSTTGCSASSAHRSGAPSPAALGSTSPASPPRCPRCAPAAR